MRFCLSSRLKCPKTLMKIGTFQNGLKVESCKCIVLKTLRFKSGWVKTEALENGDEKNVIFCRFISVFGGFLVWTIGEGVSKSMRFRLKTYECGQVKTKRNASVGENVLLRFG